jgi:hypothetical protein
VAGVIVAGMHRSSTSLVTSVFAASGYWMPPDQLKPRPDNPKGYFEDRRLHHFHRRLLEAYRLAWDLSPRLRKVRRRDLTIPDELRPRAEELLAPYRAHDHWVWKNPRATLWLEEWLRWFPDATFVICVRSPAGVVDSMLRRNDIMRISTRWPLYRTRRFFRALSIWRSYNLMALRFAVRHPDRCVFVRIPDDIPALEQMSGQTLFDPRLLRRPRASVRVPAMFALRTAALHRRLAARADVAALEPLLRSAQAAGAGER